MMTHDSIGLGEDGPTHQPIEHLASFRAMPNMNMFRPCGGNETAGAYKVAVSSRKRPSTIALSRQGMLNLPGCSVDGVAKGAYVIHGGEGTPDAIIVGTGSELPMAVEAAKKLEAEGKKVSEENSDYLFLCCAFVILAGVCGVFVLRAQLVAAAAGWMHHVANASAPAIGSAFSG